MYVSYADENKVIFVRTILSTTITTRDAGLPQVDPVTVRTLDDARSLTLWYLGLEPEILMFIAYAQKPPVNVYAGVSSGNMFNCYLGVYLHPNFVYASCEGYGENAHLCRLA